MFPPNSSFGGYLPGLLSPGIFMCACQKVFSRRKAFQPLLTQRNIGHILQRNILLDVSPPNSSFGGYLPGLFSPGIFTSNEITLALRDTPTSAITMRNSADPHRA